MKTKILLVVLTILVIMQFFTIDKTTPNSSESSDFLVMMKTPPNIATIIKSACYDCHSYQSTYPWYTSVAPLSWWIKHHIDEGREHLNFSTWSDYEFKKMNHKLKECSEMIEENEMPLTSYKVIHSEARLSDNDRTLLNNYFTSLYNGKPAVDVISNEEEIEID